MRKILLMNTPVYTSGNGKAFDINPLPPIGMAYLSTALKKNGFQVKILDVIMKGYLNRRKVGKKLYYIGLEYPEIKKIIELYNPDYIGVSAMFSRQSSIYKDIVELIKKTSDKIIVIVGGAHATVDPYSLLQDNNVDFVLTGESDISFPLLLKTIENEGDFSAIDGIGYRKDGQLIVLPKKSYISDLDALGFPDWDEVKIDQYFGLKYSHGTRKKKRFAPIVTSRGCPYNCVFCSAKKVWGRKYRMRSPENVFQELLWLKNKYGIEEIMIEDDNLTLEPKRAEKIFDLMIHNNLNLIWDTPNGIAAWTLNKQLIEKMVKSGCCSISLAIESGSQHHLTYNIHKPVDLKKIKGLVDIINLHDIIVFVYIVFGVPGETKFTMFDTYRYVGGLGLGPESMFVSIATPYYGTELYDICKEKKYLKNNFSTSDFHIRSYSIDTEYLSSFDIKLMMKIGVLYLVCKQKKYFNIFCKLLDILFVFLEKKNMNAILSKNLCNT